MHLAMVLWTRNYSIEWEGEHKAQDRERPGYQGEDRRDEEDA
jgi:hypothetical protein